VSGLPSERSYEVLGSLLTVRCAHEACAQAIDRFFGPLGSAPWTTPDWIVECDLRTPSRQLFRERASSEPLEGVRVQLRGQERPEPWTAPQPPLLPLASDPLRDRFVGLHGACLAIGTERAALVVGDRAAGKTTLATTLPAAGGGWALMSDEWSFLLRRTAIAHPFPQAIGILDRGEKTWWRADEVVPVQTAPRPVTDVVFLEAGAGAEVEPVEPVAALRLLQQHHLDTGTSQDEGMVTLARLVRGARLGAMAPVDHARRQEAAAAVRRFAEAR
jgi:hypothetical protein